MLRAIQFRDTLCSLHTAVRAIARHREEKMHKNRGPSSQNDNEWLFMHHGTRRAEKS